MKLAINFLTALLVLLGFTNFANADQVWNGSSAFIKVYDHDNGQILVDGDAIVFSRGEKERSTSNPMRYAEQHSLLYSEGDVGDTSGWEGCLVSELHPQTVRIHCDGAMTVLVHGGHRSKKRFECEYIFERQSEYLFRVQKEICN